MKTKKNSRNKAPAFQFYPADWLTDSSLRLASAETRGVWIDLLCHCWLSSEPGFLIVGGVELDKNGIRKLSGMTPKKFEKVFNELTNFGILRKDEKGRFYSKRMVEDWRLRQIRRESGAKGGNPALTKKRKKVNNLVNQNVNQKQTPSSSSSYINTNTSYLIKYIYENCPSVSKLKNQLNEDQALCLELDFGRAAVVEILDQMENFKDLQKKYKSVNLTCRNWLKRNEKRNNSSKNGSFEDQLRNF